jgi:hypothetical protein
VDPTIDLGTLAELGVAIAGFGALITLFRGGSIGSWHPRLRMALWYIVSQGLGAALFALLPSLLVVVTPGSWTAALLALACFHAVAFAALLRRHFVLVAEDDRTPNLWFYWLNGGIAAANAVVLVAGAFGWLVAAPDVAYRFGVASCVILACFAFIGVLRQVQQVEAADGDR